jgi:hypothetical protein
MSTDELFKAFGVFNAGLKEYAIGTGIRQATDQLQQLNQSTVNETELKQQKFALANNLASQLVGLGANSEQIQLATQAFSPKFKSAAEAISAGDTSAAKSMTDAEAAPALAVAGVNNTAAMDREVVGNKSKEKIAQWNNESALEVAKAKAVKGFDEQEKKHLARIQASFNSVAKDAFKSRESAKTAREMITSNNPMAQQAASTLFAKATGDVGNLTNEERIPYKTSKALGERIQQAVKELATGTLTEDNKKFALELAAIYEGRADQTIESHADRVATQGAALLKRDPLEVREIIHPKVRQQSAPPNSAPGAAPRKSLRDLARPLK